MFRRSSQGVIQVIGGDEPLIGEVVETVRELLLDVLGQGQPLAVLDAGQIVLIDSNGLEMLLDVQDEYRRHGGELKLANLSPLCRDILGVTGLDREFELSPEVRSAIGGFLK